ncbi:DMT family transporter [Pseudomonas sp. ML96]|uniref:DMT family transporter n=1 Tax=Pseudomonas sp. ML96 TaxID=1523503 RepID=UPI0005BD17ED|nr:DMT family transporter [Pseudomonas sp. ML96]
MWVYVRLVAVAMIWGGTFVAGRHLAGGMEPLVAAAMRFIIASLTLALVLPLGGAPLARPTPRQWLQLALLGSCGVFLYNLCFFFGLQYTSASRAALIVALNPALIALAGFLFYGERLTSLRLFGIVLCLAGAGLVILGREGSVLEGAWWGDLLILGCVLSWVIYSVFSRGLSQALGPLHTVSYSIWLGTLMLCAAALALSRGAWSMPNIDQWLSLLYLGAIGSALAYIWYYDGIRRIGATRSGVFIALNPLTAVLFGTLLLDEQLTAQIALGGVLAIVGIYFCNRLPRERLA